MEGDPVTAVTGDPDDVLAELFGYDIGTINILPAEPVVSATDVTYSCSSPNLCLGVSPGS
jgi:hypothetical protein